MLKRTLRRLISVPSVPIRSYLQRSSHDVLAYLKGERTGIVPPSRLLFDGSHSRDQYRNVGTEFVGYMVELAGLRATDSVLDVGCGIGRMASALAGVIGPDGAYEGFDVVPIGIRWCNAHIHNRYPKFRFQHANVFNSLYNPGGTLKGADYRFPYSDGQFDLVIATSVFTHMLPHDVDTYIREIARVLKQSGRCFLTCFLRTPEAEAGIRAGKSFLHFECSMDGYWAEVARTPEGAIAYQESDVLALLARHELELIRPIHYGSWCGREPFLSVQDIVIVHKHGQGAEAPATGWRMEERL